MDKYYKPNREDLRLGYSCEMRMPDNGYIKFKIDDENLECDKETFVFSKTADIRTKRLDKVDLESFRWVFIATNKITDWYEYAGDTEGVRDLYDHWPWKIELLHLKDRNKIRINMVLAGNEETVFEGICNSINELEQIHKFIRLL